MNIKKSLAGFRKEREKIQITKIQNQREHNNRHYINKRNYKEKP